MNWYELTWFNLNSLHMPTNEWLLFPQKRPTCSFGLEPGDFSLRRLWLVLEWQSRWLTLGTSRWSCCCGCLVGLVGWSVWMVGWVVLVRLVGGLVLWFLFLLLLLLLLFLCQLLEARSFLHLLAQDLHMPWQFYAYVCVYLYRVIFVMKGLAMQQFSTHHDTWVLLEGSWENFRYTNFLSSLTAILLASSRSSSIGSSQ